MRKHILISLLLLLHLSAFSQQLPHFSQYMLNGFLINPALAGSENYAEIKTGYRNQWAGVEGAPESYYLTAHMPLGKMNMNTTATSVPYRGRNGSKALFKAYTKRDVTLAQPHHGLGFTAITDKAGALKRSDFGLTYAYHLPLNKELKMSAGITGGLSAYKVDEESLQLTDPNDPTFTGGNYNRVKPNITAGLLLYSKRFYIGSASSQILQDELTGSLSQDDSNEASSRVHHYLMGGYKVMFTPNLSMLPSVLVKYASPAPLSVDANLKLLYKDKAWIGGSYRQNNDFVLLGGLNMNNLLQVGYAYDMATSGIGRIGGGAHEVVLGILINNNGKIFSPSDFW
ncbi:PorP/SprF family type IX secretion system membrane protein [Pontibacter sp. MBLB2868]|uniref:PorP/SprF family type IX secretion system membrane protein n=1 Tax=Pontibacter sp. MBLB2868 TaxID=3451555 RepID=UPI003F756730